jgi:PAS domain S-box-containing protein
LRALRATQFVRASRRSRIEARPSFLPRLSRVFPGVHRPSRLMKLWRSIPLGPTKRMTSVLLEHSDDAGLNWVALNRQLEQIEMALRSLVRCDASVDFAARRQTLEDAAALLLIKAREQGQLCRRLRAQEEQLAIALSMANVASRELNIAAGTVRWSSEMYRIHGCDPDHFIPVPDSSLALTHSQDQAEVQAATRAALAGQHMVSVEHRLLMHDGTIKFVQQNWQVVRDKSGAPTRLLSTCQDITRRKQAEDALSQAQSQLRMVSRLGRIGAWKWDRATGTPSWSDEVCLIHDVEPGTQPTSEQAIEFYAPEWRETMRRAGQRCIEHGTPFDLELELVTKRRRLWVRAIGEAVRDASGVITGIQGAFQDVSDRQQAAEETRRLAAKFTTILETVVVGFIAVDCGWRLTYLNGEAERQLGSLRESALGRELWEELPNFLNTAFEKAFREVMVTGNRTLIESQWPGTQRWLRASVYRFEDGLAIYLYDVTTERAEHQALEELNQQLEVRVQARTTALNLARQEAEQAAQAKAAFLATMSHEIRTPLNGVIGLLDVLTRSNVRDDQTEIVHLVQDSADMLLRIIDDVLQFSKLEAGKLQLDCAPICFAETVEKVCSMLDATASKAGVCLTVFVAPEIPDLLIGDELRLRQVILNLVGNAIKFSSGRAQPGRVSVRAEVVERHSNGIVVDISVRDNGIGIDPDVVSRLFAPFSQADASDSRRYGGTGLGLTISKMLVSLMGGEITVLSRLDQGSVFTVRLKFEQSGTMLSSPVGDTIFLGLECSIVGAEQPLAEDLGRYLRHAGAVVERVAELAEVDYGREDTRVWIVLPDQREGTGWRHLLSNSTKLNSRRMLVLGHGRRRRAHLWHPGVWIDVEGLTRRAFYDAVALAARHTPRGPVVTVPRSTVSIARPAGSINEGPLILVVEDNATNREVIKRQLNLMFCTPVVVSGGREALERWRAGAFAMVLCDLRMPEMDGFALAAAIRAEEGTGNHIPIIALTATVLPEKRQQARDAGMDDFLAKPVRLATLKEILEKWLRPVNLQSGDAPLRQAGADDPVDLSVPMSLVGGDPAQARDVLKSFQRTSHELHQELDSAVRRNLMSAAYDLAHKLKGSALSVGAYRLSEICAQIEDIRYAGRVDRIEVLMTSLARELTAVYIYLASLER